MRLGELLLKEHIIDQKQLSNAIEKQLNSNKKLGEILVDLGYISEDVLMKFIADKMDIEYLDLSSKKIDLKAARKLPEKYAARFKCLVLEEHPDYVLVGMVDPTDSYAQDMISSILQSYIKLAVISVGDWQDKYFKIYQRKEEITELIHELSGELEATDVAIQQLGGDLSQEDAPVVKLILSLFKDAVQTKCSDIHIEPESTLLRIRKRIDGVLQEQILKEHNIANPLIQRLKIMANLNIAERRIPQDGRFNLKILQKSIDVRLSTMPIQFGESVVMRLLDQSAPVANISKLGMGERVRKQVEKILTSPNGILLVTGPTGSGKTTSLYSFLSRLNDPGVKIITVEDPVEYRIERVNQVQVNPKIELTFARVLRAILRQDPDIVLVGEIRDKETAEIAMRAALTGHFVMATLHTNDSISAALRLNDMGIPGYLTASSLRAIIAQRLMRLICPKCIEEYSPTANEKIWLEKYITPKQKISLKTGAGCKACNNTGYSGRVGIYEFLEPPPAAITALSKNDQAAFSKACQDNPDFFSLTDEAIELALAGKTTIAEVIRVSGEVE
jgi:MSHA biogenesis protein MshE